MTRLVAVIWGVALGNILSLWILTWAIKHLADRIEKLERKKD